MTVAASARMFTLLAAMTFCLLLSSTHAISLDFPKLTGRVVDQAGLLSASHKQDLVQLLEIHEQKTTNQVVVVTVTSLQGVPIEQFGQMLGNHWGIGQKKKDNGVLLVVAPLQRKVRIEVGNGLERFLTDGIAQHIIDNQILPSFRKDDMAMGVSAGTIAIVQALEGSYNATRQNSGSSRSKDDSPWWSKLLKALGFLLWPIAAVFRLTGAGGGSSGGGGFSGGGGSFGGGGASGSW